MKKKFLALVLALLTLPLVARADGPTDPTPVHHGGAPASPGTTDTVVSFLRSIFHV
jgi:hypothetical protein